MLVPANDSKNILKTYEGLWTKIKDLIRTKTNNLDKYDEKYTKIKFKLDGNLPLKKLLELHLMLVVVRSFSSRWQQILSARYFRGMFV